MATKGAEQKAPVKDKEAPKKETPKKVYDLKNMSLLQKIVEVRRHIGGFDKDKKADKFDYVSGSQALGKILDKMNELELLLVPTILHGTEKWEKDTFERVNKYKEVKRVVDYIVQCQVVMVWLDANRPDEKLEVPWLLYGEQEGDISQAFGSGLTYMERYFIMKFFNQPTDWLDPDSKKEPEGSQLTEEEKAQIEAREKAEAEQRAIEKRFVKKDEVDTLNELLRTRRVPVSEIYRRYSVESVEELRYFQFAESSRELSSMPVRVKDTKALEGIE